MNKDYNDAMVSKFFSGLLQRKPKDLQSPSIDSKSTAPPVKRFVDVGALLEQRYRLDAELGRGGMGVVYRAHDIVLDRDCAVKVLYADNTTVETRASLLHEAEATARLNHPNIIAVYHTGNVDIGVPEPAPFVVMELARGKSLGEFRGLVFAQIIEIAQQICAALDHAHSQGLVHRDLKPDNVLVEKQGNHFVAKLVDFGLARPRGVNDGNTAGTVFYIAPEVIAGQPADIAADLYSLGVMLYEMVTGRVPFSDFDSNSILSQHLKESVVPPSHTRTDLPPALESIILRLLAKDPKDRFASAREVSTALDQITLAPEKAQTARNNLPQPLTSFIGREKELAQVMQLLGSNRLVTLTGFGGIGKTRLMLATGAALTDQFPDGVWWVDLAAWNDPRLVPPIVASILGVREESRRRLMITLTEFLAEKNLLLLFDNCDQLNAACAQFADTIVRACPAVRIMATSHAALNVANEIVYQVSPLSTRYQVSETNLVSGDAMRLLIDRSITASPAYKINDENLALLEPICRQLNGIPLAIELVAARLRSMSLVQIVDQLSALDATSFRAEREISTLPEMSRRAAPRHDNPSPDSTEPTLNAVIDWSYSSLSEQARVLINRLSVFVGGFTLDTAESYSGTGFLDVMSLLTQLVNASLVNLSSSNSGEARYRIHETIRQFALEQLRAAGEEESTRRNHRDGFFLLAIQAEPNLHGGQQGMALKHLESEYANLLAALDWTVERPQDAATAFRFGGALWQFWSARGYWREGAERLEKILALPHTLSQARARVQVVIGAGYLAIAQADYTSAQKLLEEALAIARDANDQRSAAFAQCGLGSIAQSYGDYMRAETLFHDGWVEFQSAGNRWETANALLNLGNLRMRQKDYFSARKYLAASLDVFRQLGDKRSVAQVLRNLGLIAYYRQNYADARAWFEEGLAIWRGLYDQFGMANQLYNLGYVALRQGQVEQARAFFSESLTLFQAMNNRRLVANVLYGIAGTLAAQRQSERAAQLIGAAETLSNAPGPQIETAIGAEEDKNWVMSHIQLDESAMNTARTAGRAMSMEQAVKRAMEK